MALTHMEEVQFLHPLPYTPVVQWLERRTYNPLMMVQLHPGVP